MRSRVRRSLAVIVSILLAVAAGFLLNNYYLYVLSLMMVNAIAATGLVVVSGIGGQISLATSALLGIGAYTTAILMVHLGAPYIVAAIAGVVVTTALGTLLAAPALRLTPIHLAIVTLAFGIVVMQMIGKGGWLTGGMQGLTPDGFALFGLPLDSSSRMFLWIFFCFALTTGASVRFARSKAGRALLAIREGELAAKAIGINTSGYKTLAFAYSSALAGLSGALYAALVGYVSVDDFSLQNSIYFFVMIALGGMTSVPGGIIGAALVTVLPEVLRDLQEAANAVFGVLLFVILVFLPSGIAPAVDFVGRRILGRTSA